MDATIIGLVIATIVSFMWITFLCTGVKNEEDRKEFMESRMRELREAEEKKRKRAVGDKAKKQVNNKDREIAEARGEESPPAP